MNSLSSAGLRDRLRKISDEYSDSLSQDTRRRIVTTALHAIPSHRTGSTWYILPRLAAAAAVLAVLAFPAFRMTPAETPQESNSVRNLQVTAKGGEVILTWQDGEKPHRVVRATTREELSHLGQIPGEVVRGERWVDSRSDNAAVVYYLID